MPNGFSSGERENETAKREGLDKLGIKKEETKHKKKEKRESPET
jgi:hypothetical protein